MNITQAIREAIGQQGQRLRALAIRGLAQVIAALPPLVVLAKYGAGGAGLFAILLAVGGISLVLELGFSYRLQNEVSRGENTHPYTWGWFFLKSGFLPHLVFNIFLGLLFCHYSAFVVPRFFPPEVARVLAGSQSTLMILVLVTTISAATYHGRSIIFGLGHIDLGFFLALLGALISMVLVVAGCLLKAPVAIIAVCALSTSLIERIIGCIYCFSGIWPLKRHRLMPPPVATVTDPDLWRGRKVAFMFFYLQLISMVANNIDAIFAGRCRSLTTVGEFAFLLKLFGVPLLIVNVINTSAWPRLAVEARDRVKGARHTILALLKNNLLVMVGLGTLIVMSAEFFYHVLSGAQGKLLLLSLLMLFDCCFQVVRGVMTTFVNAAEIIWINLIGNTIFSFAAIFLKINMVDRYGINGLVLANMLSYIVFLLPFHLMATFRSPRQMTTGEA